MNHRWAVACVAGFAVVLSCWLVRAMEPRATGAGPQVSAGEALDVSPRDGVLVLRNGETLSGRITRVGDQFDLTLPTSQWRIKAADVDFVCGSLAEAYQRKAAALPPRSAADRVALAEWCLRQKLFDAADQELSRAEAIEPAYPRAAVVRRRLELALNPPPALPAAAPSSAPPPTKAREAAAPTLTNDEIERRLATLPPDVVETFALQVQPALIASCGQSGCHGQRTKSEFHVTRLPPARSSARRVTLRNLYSAVEQLDRADVANSPLLKYAMTAHGGAKDSPIANRERTEFQDLAAWAAALHDVKPEPTAAAPTAAPAKPPVAPAAKNVPTSLLETPHSEPPATAQRPTQAAPASPATGRHVEYLAPAGGDPFDPEVFNRRYLPEAAPPGR